MKLEQIKILFQDVDGCLNPEDGEGFGADASWEPSANQIAMLEAIDGAVDASPLEHLVINTGRFWPICRNLSKYLKTPKLRYFLLEHASVIYDRVEDRNLDLVQMANDCGLPDLAKRYANLETMEQLLSWYDAAGQAAMEAIFGGNMARLEKDCNLSFDFPANADPATVQAAIESLARESLSAEAFAQLEFCRSDSFIDILPEITKMDGITLLSAYLKIDLTDALAMGDYLNDLSIFENFEQVICPANAHPRIIELAQSKGSSGHVSPHSFGAALIDFLS